MLASRRYFRAVIESIIRYLLESFAHAKWQLINFMFGHRLLLIEKVLHLADDSPAVSWIDGVRDRLQPFRQALPAWIV